MQLLFRPGDTPKHYRGNYDNNGALFNITNQYINYML